MTSAQDMFRRFSQVKNNLPTNIFTKCFSSQFEAPLPTFSAAIPDLPADTKTASVALIGAPNAGKSSLSNAIVKARVSAVSRKVNTTRNQIIAAYTEGNRQLIFQDTPGLVEAQFVKALGAERRELTTGGWGAASDADIAVVVVDSSRGDGYLRRCIKISKQIAEVRSKYQKQTGMVLALNKIDKTKPRTRILLAVEMFQSELENFDQIFEDRVFMVSAYNSKGVDDIRNKLLDMTTDGDFDLPSDTCHGDEDLDLVRQHIWEKLLHRVHEEVPYRCSFKNETMMELPNGDLFVSEIIRVPKSSAVGIVIGPGGKVIEWIRDTAEHSSSEVLGRKVHLKLRVALA